ncbi:MAG TPA: hypothetical protein VI386_35860 [Candidatus Sulfotelmatobacter sp.]
MTQINLVTRKTKTRNSVSRNSASWGRTVRNNAGPFVFAAVLIVCSVAVGCSSEKPQPLTSNNPAPIAPSRTTANAASLPVPEAKTASKKVVKKRPATVTYTDKAHGVSFAYPRRYAIETGDAVKDVLASSPLPMNFVHPGGVALAAVELPETGFANTDFSSAFFNVSVNNALTEEQCSEFSVPQSKVTSSTSTSEGASSKSSSTNVSDPQPTKLMLGDLEMHGAEAVSGEGARQSDSKYFHVFQNGACYEFALNVTTNAAQADGAIRHVDRDKLFAKLESILSTVKIDSANAEPEKSAVKTDAPNTGAEKADAQKFENAKKDGTGTAAVTTDAVTPEAPQSDVPKSEAAPVKPAEQPAPLATTTPANSGIPPQ